MEKKNNIDPQYNNLLKDILENGIKKQTRNGEVLSVFGRQIRHKMSEGFPLLTGKKMFFKGIVTELLWFLRGDTNIKYLVNNNCHIWDGDCFANYYRNFEKYLNTLPEGSEVEFIINKDKFINKIKTDDEFAKKWGELGPIYGKQWRSWHWRSEPVLPREKDMIYTTDDRMVLWSEEKYIDQISNLIKTLKTNPDDRRMMVNAWNVGEIDKMVLPPCHYGFQVYTRELTWEEKVQWVFKNTDIDMENFYITNEIYKDTTPKRAISLMWNQRSVDTFLGLPFNIASYGLLLEILAKECNMVADELIGNLGDTHIYLNHIEAVQEQLKRDSYPLPNLFINTEFWQTESGECGIGPLKTNLQGFEISDFEIENYISHPAIKAPLSN
jgi:thymidylate synthase